MSLACFLLDKPVNMSMVCSHPGSGLVSVAAKYAALREKQNGHLAKVQTEVEDRPISYASAAPLWRDH